MNSTQSNAQFLFDLYANWSRRMQENPNMTIEDFRSMFDEWHQPTLEPEEVSYKIDVVAGVEGLWVYPKDADLSKVIIYTHGGGFAVGSSASHRKLVGPLAKYLGVCAFVVDYRRSPEHVFPAQIQDVTAVYKELLQRGFTAKNMLTAGDSAGGNLAISTVLNLRNEGIELPGAVIAFSPWLDMEHKGETLISNDSTDALITVDLLKGMSQMFLGEHGDPANPLANPLKANYQVFPRLYINAGSVESLVDNATRLADIAKKEGVDVTLSVVDNMQHVFPFLAGRASEADQELAKIAQWFKA